MVKKFFLPAGILVAVLLTLVLPQPGAYGHRSGLMPCLIVLIFAINGWQVKWRESKLNRSLLTAFCLGAGVSLLLGPLLGRGMGALLFTAPMLVLGLTVIAASPTMIASGIVTTEVAAGNTLWALLFTLGFNLFSVVTAPFMLQWCIDGLGGIRISPWTLLFKLIVMMLVPFLIGTGLRRLFQRVTMPPWFGYVPSVAVILIVYASLAAARAELLAFSPALLGATAFGAMVIHLALLGLLALLGRRWLKLAAPENRALYFTGAQKSMVVALSILTAMGGKSSDAVTVILVAYFCQLLFDSFFAAWLSRHTRI